jgi:anthranilate 1,2-dioxygenase small subunit
VADGQYLVTTRENQRKRCRVGVMYCDGRGMMHDRVTGLRQAIVFEPHVYRHIVGGVLINAEDDDSYAVESNFHILRTGAEGAMITYGCGRYLDEITGSSLTTMGLANGEPSRHQVLDDAPTHRPYPSADR